MIVIVICDFDSGFDCELVWLVVFECACGERREVCKSVCRRCPLYTGCRRSIGAPQGVESGVHWQDAWGEALEEVPIIYGHDSFRTRGHVRMPKSAEKVLVSMAS